MRKKDRDEDDDTADDAAEPEAAADSPEYQFAGYDVVLSEKVALTPPQPRQQKGPARS